MTSVKAMCKDGHVWEWTKHGAWASGAWSMGKWGAHFEERGERKGAFVHGASLGVTFGKAAWVKWRSNQGKAWLTSKNRFFFFFSLIPLTHKPS